MPETQSASNHTRFDPVWHFFVAPVFLLNVVFAVYLLIRDWHTHWRRDGWGLVVSLALLLLTATVRGYSLKVQDRVIRLEERLRLSAMLSPAEVAAINGKQLIALRFASDAEVAALARRAVAERLEPKAIKASIVTWRPDHDRV